MPSLYLESTIVFSDFLSCKKKHTCTHTEGQFYTEGRVCFIHLNSPYNVGETWHGETMYTYDII